jgi:hypothetical protein
MAKPLQPGFVYIDSAVLQQRIAFHKKSGWLFCEDKYPNGELVKYSPKELQIIYDSGEELAIGVHIVKKIFTGEIVGYDKGTGNDNPGKPDAGRIEDHSTDSGSPGEKISGASGNGQAVRDGELEIY